MFDIVIIGGGILGTTLAYQLSKITTGAKIVVLEKENDVAQHTSGRNTGVLHRPFYLDPVKKGKFARCAQESYGFWKEYAAKKSLPWKEVGTLEVALDAQGFERLKKYKQWSLQNGMADKEVRLLTVEEARAIEPSVRCIGALLCTTDTAVDFGAFTRSLKQDAQAQGVEFKMGYEVKRVKESGAGIEVEFAQGSINAKYLINCAGGAALKIAHITGLAKEYADMNFRGEYLAVEGSSARLAFHNIYSVPRHSDFPFLDPHYVVRHDGRVEIGPTAVPVFGPYAYRGLGKVLSKITEPPVMNKLKLCANAEFLKLCAQEWRSAISARAMVARVQKFLPELRFEDCVNRSTAGVRASLIDRHGKFVPETVEVKSPCSLHVLNYNSPGATGAPAYAAYLVELISKQGVLSNQ